MKNKFKEGLNKFELLIKEYTTSNALPPSINDLALQMAASGDGIARTAVR